VTNSAGAVTSAVATLTVGVTPGISQEPANLVLTQGQSGMFSVVASGTGPVAYQWRFGGTPLNGAGASSYAVSAAISADAGPYDVIVSNPYGSITSTVAQLTVLVPPSLTVQPTNQTVGAGGVVTFQANAIGTSPLSYQWFFNGSALPGAATNTLLLSDVQAGQAGTYSLVVSNAAGFASSSNADLKILVAPSAGAPASSPSGFTISVSSVAGLSYVLEFKNALQDSSWTPTSAWYSGTGGTLVLQDTNSPAGSRFYRIRCQ